MFGGLFQTVMQVPYILTASPPSLNKANIPTALQAGQKGEKKIQKLPSL